MNEVKTFLAHFHEYSDIEDVFTKGCCYWFAMILATRFEDDGAEIVYDETANHFGTAIDGAVYDITGDVTDDYTWELWDDLDDELLRERIIRDCVMF